MATRLSVSDILANISNGDEATPAQLEKVGEAAAGLRHEFLKEAFEAAKTLSPMTDHYENFKNSLKAMIGFLLPHEFITQDEVGLLWVAVENREKGRP